MKLRNERFFNFVTAKFAFIERKNLLMGGAQCIIDQTLIVRKIQLKSEINSSLYQKGLDCLDGKIRFIAM